MSGFVGYDPDRLRRLDAALDAVAGEAVLWRSGEPLAQAALWEARRGVEALAELRPSLARILGGDAGTFQVVDLGAGPVFGLPMAWRVALAAGLGRHPAGADADGLVLDLLALLADDRAAADRDRWPPLVARLEAVVADPVAAARFLEGLGPEGVARLLAALHERTDTPGAIEGVAAAVPAVARALGPFLAGRADAPTWEHALATQGPAVVARALAAGSFPDGSLGRLAHGVLSGPPPAPPWFVAYRHDDVDLVAAALARRADVARDVLVGLDRGALGRLLARPSDGAVGELLVHVADPRTLGPVSADRVLGPVLEAITRQGGRIDAATADRLGDVVGPWLVDLGRAAVAGPGAEAPFARWDAAGVATLAATVARSRQAATDLAAWCATLTASRSATAGTGVESRREHQALGLTGAVTSSGIVAGRRAWAAGRAQDRALVVEVLSWPLGKLAAAATAPLSAVPLLGDAVDHARRWLTGEVAARLAQVAGAGDRAEPERVGAAAEDEREAAYVVLATAVLAAHPAVPAGVVLAARAAPDRLALQRAVAAWCDEPGHADDPDRAAVREALDAFHRGWAGCDQRICR